MGRRSVVTPSRTRGRSSTIPTTRRTHTAHVIRTTVSTPRQTVYQGAPKVCVSVGEAIQLNSSDQGITPNNQRDSPRSPLPKPNSRSPSLSTPSVSHKPRRRQQRPRSLSPIEVPQPGLSASSPDASPILVHAMTTEEDGEEDVQQQQQQHVTTTAANVSPSAPAPRRASSVTVSRRTPLTRGTACVEGSPRPQMPSKLRAGRARSLSVGTSTRPAGGRHSQGATAHAAAHKSEEEETPAKKANKKTPSQPALTLSEGSPLAMRKNPLRHWAPPARASLSSPLRSPPKRNAPLRRRAARPRRSETIQPLVVEAAPPPPDFVPPIAHFPCQKRAKKPTLPQSFEEIKKQREALEQMYQQSRERIFSRDEDGVLYAGSEPFATERGFNTSREPFGEDSVVDEAEADAVVVDSLSDSVFQVSVATTD